MKRGDMVEQQSQKSRAFLRPEEAKPPRGARCRYKPIHKRLNSHPLRQIQPPFVAAVVSHLKLRDCRCLTYKQQVAEKIVNRLIRRLLTRGKVSLMKSIKYLVDYRDAHLWHTNRLFSEIATAAADDGVVVGRLVVRFCLFLFPECRVVGRFAYSRDAFPIYCGLKSCAQLLLLGSEEDASFAGSLDTDPSGGAICGEQPEDLVVVGNAQTVTQ